MELSPSSLALAALLLIILLATSAQAEEYWGTAPEVPTNWYGTDKPVPPGEVQIINTGPAIRYEVKTAAGTTASGGLATMDDTKEEVPSIIYGSQRTRGTGFVVETDGPATVDHGLFVEDDFWHHEWHEATRVLSYAEIGRNYTVHSAGTPLRFDPDAEPGRSIAIVAPRDGIEVTVTVTADITGQFPPSPGGVPAINAGDTYTWTLDQFDALHLHATSSLSGTRIEASQPIAVFTSAAAITTGMGVEGVGFEQVLPDDMAGRVHVACTPIGIVPAATAYIHVMGIEPGSTSVTVTPGAPGTSYTLTGPGDELWLRASQDHVIESDRPVWVHAWRGLSGRGSGGTADYLVPAIDLATTSVPWAKPFAGDKEQFHAMLGTPKGASITGAYLTSRDIPGTGYACLDAEVNRVISFTSTGPLTAMFTGHEINGAAMGLADVADCRTVATSTPAMPVASLDARGRLTWTYPTPSGCIDGVFEIALANGTLVSTVAPWKRESTVPLPEPCSSTAYKLRYAAGTTGPWSNTIWLNVTGKPWLAPVALAADLDTGTLSWEAADEPCSPEWYDIFHDGVHVITVHGTTYGISALEPCSTTIWAVAAANPNGRGAKAAVSLKDGRCPEPIVPESSDSDGDGAPDGLDNCEATTNPHQADADGNGVGDACETVFESSAPVLNGGPPGAMDCDLALPQDALLTASQLSWSYKEDCLVTGFSIWLDQAIAFIPHTGNNYSIDAPGNLVHIQVETTEPGLPALIPGRFVTASHETPVPMEPPAGTRTEAPPTMEGGVQAKTPTWIAPATLALVALVGILILLFVAKRRRHD